MITKDVKDFREPTEWWSRTREMPRISEVRVDNIVRDSAKTSSSHVSWETGTKTTCTHVPGDPITVSEALYRVEDSSQCWRHCTVSETLRFFAQSGPASRPTSQRLDPSTVSRRHTTMSETSRVRRHPTMSETSIPIRIWPSVSRPVFGSLLSRGRLASFCVWRWLSPVWCFRRSCRSFEELSPRPFPRFGAFLFLRVCCPGPVFSVGSEAGRFDGLNKFSLSWTKMV